MANIGDVFMRLLLEDGDLQAQAIRQGTKAGDAAGGAMGRSMSQNLGKALSLMGVGTVFAAFTKGGMELNQTLTDVQARSGAVGAQWDAMSAAIQRQNRRTTLSLTEIGDGVSAIKTDLGATGSEIGLAADKLTNFALVANEAFASSVKGADDLKDAFEVDLLEALKILDALVVSTQTYGGTLVDNRTALVELAPTLKAANLGWQQGLELINLFNSAGIDAAAIPVALQHALEKVKTPQELMNLIAQIQATEDPLLRAQKAADLFGAKAGAKLADALAPGRGALTDYAVNVDQAAGATDRAAQKIDSSWRRTIDLMIQNITGLAAEAGNAIGPIASIAGSLGSAITGFAFLFPGSGPRMIAGLRSLIARILPGVVAQGAVVGTAMGASAAAAEVATEATGVATGQAVVAAGATPAAAAAGGVLGRVIGVAAAGAVAAAIAAGIALSLNAINDLRTQQDQIMAEGNLTRAEALAFQLSQMSEANRQDAFKRGALNAFKNFGTTYEDALRSAQPKMDAAAKASAASGLDAASSTLAGGQGQIGSAATTAFAGLPAGVAAQLGPTRAAILKLLHDAADSVSSRRSQIDSEISALNDLLKKPDVNRTTELERLLKARTAPALEKALHSTDIEKRTAARALAADLDDTIATLNPRPGIMSATSKKLIADLEASTSPDLKAFASWFEAQLGVVAASPPRIPAGTRFPGKAADDLLQPDAAKRSAAARAVQDLVHSALGTADPFIKNDAQNEGRQFATSLASGIADPASKNAALKAGQDLIGSLIDWLKSDSVHRWIVDAWHAITSGLSFVLPTPASTGHAPGTGPLRDSGGPVTAGVSYIIGLNRQPELFIPGVSGLVATIPQVAAAAGGGSRAQNIYMETVNIADAHDEFSLTQQLQFLAEAG